MGLLLLVPVVILLSAREIPQETSSGPLAEAREAGAGMYDLLLGDRPGRSDGQAADPGRETSGGSLFPEPTDGRKYSVAYGLAVPRRGNGGRLWQLVEPPTRAPSMSCALTGAISVPATDTGAADRVSPAATSYGRLLYDTLDDDRVGWRPAHTEASPSCFGSFRRWTR